MAGLEGQRLGGCLLVRLIGHGGVGEVYLADQPELGRQVAVKVLRLEFDPSADAAAAARASAQFTQEARLIASLDHPNILPIYAFGAQDGLHYLIMPYVRDGSLADLVAPGPTHRLDLPLPPAVAAGLISQAAAGLQAAHDHQPSVVHGDVKPANLLARLLPVNPALTPGMTPGMTPGGAPAALAQVQVLLADFGLARAVTGGETGQTQRGTGTPLYTAAEQYNGPAVPASDQYALACVAYELLTGHHVFDGEPAALYQQHSFVTPLSPRQRNPLLPPAVDPVLLRALAKAPAQRYARVEEFAQALRTALDPAGMAASQGLGGWPGGVARPTPSPTLPPPGLPAGMVPGPVGAPPPLPPPLPPPPAFSSPLVPPPFTPPAVSAPAHARPDAPGAPIPPDNEKIRRRALLGGGIAAGVIVLAGAAGGGVYWFSHNHTPSKGPKATNTAAKHPGDTLGIYRPSSGTFILEESLAANSAFISLAFGKPGLVPVTGDWNGDGVDTLGVYDPASLTFMLADKNEQGARITHRFLFGQPGDIPLAGDWTGTGHDGVGIFRPATGQFILTNSLGGSTADFTMQLGQAHDLPVVGDWDGDRRDSIGVFRPSTQTFYLVNTLCNCAPTVAYVVVFGQKAGKPFAGDWTHTGRSGLGMFDPASSTMLLKNDATKSGPPDQNILFGTSGDIPLAGHWGLGL